MNQAEVTDKKASRHCEWGVPLLPSTVLGRRGATPGPPCCLFASYIQVDGSAHALGLLHNPLVVCMEGMTGPLTMLSLIMSDILQAAQSVRLSLYFVHL